MMKAKYMFIALLLTTLVSCEIKKTESGEAPKVNVDEGKLPKYDLDWARVNVTKRTKTIRVPKVVVVMEEREVEVPVLDFAMPGEESEMEEQTIKVEVDVSDRMCDIDIRRVYADGNQLIVVSELEALDQPLDGKTVRISDQIIVNAPENLAVKHYIIGGKPSGDYSRNYTFVMRESEINISGAKVLYEK